MREVHWTYLGTNNRKDFKEGVKLVFPAGDESYIDKIRLTEGENVLILTTLSDKIPGVLGPMKHGVLEHVIHLALDESGECLAGCTPIVTRLATEGVAIDYQEKLQRLEELKGRHAE